MNYLELLDRSYNTFMEYESDISKMEFLISHVFEFATYDSEQDEIIGKKLFETIDAITNGTTFEYIKNPDNYTWYLMFCNSFFLKDRLECGVSIKGSWWAPPSYNKYCIEFSTCALFHKDGEQETEWTFTVEEWKDFMRACVTYSKG